MSERRRSDPSVRRELVRATGALVARGGIPSVTERAVEALAGTGPGSLLAQFNGVDALLLATLTDLAREPSVARPGPDTEVSSVHAAVDRLAGLFRAYVNEDAVRFPALLQFSAAGVFGERRYREVTIDQHERTRAAVAEHMAVLHRSGLTGVATANLPTIARFFSDTARGIEMCHLLDRDEPQRAAAYRALVEAATRRLVNLPRASAPEDREPTGIIVDDDYRVRMVLEPSGVVRDLLLMEGIRGWNARDFVGRPIGVAIASGRGDPDRIALWEGRLAEAWRHPGTVRFRGRRAHSDPSSPESVTTTLTPIRAVDGALESILVDIEDRSGQTAAETEAFALQEQLRNALELTRLGTYVMWLREPRIIANDRFAEIYGRDPQELMDTGGVEAFLRFIHAADRDHVRSALEAAMTGEVDYVANFRFWMDTPDGPELRWISGLGRVELDDDGPFRVLGVIEDVTDRHKQQAAILQSQKRDAIGTLAAGVAHDFNNVLGAILGNATAAERELAAGRSADESLREISRGARRAGDLVNRLLSFSRDDRVPRERYSVADTIREACALIRPTLGTGIELRQSVADDLPDTIGDPTGLHQVILNLVINSDYAIGSDPVLIEIEADGVHLGDDRVDSEHTLPAGDYIRIQVRDNGPGLPADVADRAFDPFFTTKLNREHAGLGLAAAQTVVHNQGGSIALESLLGLGTVFTIHIPAEAAARAVATSPQDRAVAVAPGRTPRVLFVDDEIALTDLADRAMSAAGCAVVTTNDPFAAVDLLRADPEGFDAIVTDLAMPQMNGLGLIRHLRRIRPTIPVILTSGFITGDVREEAHTLGVGRIVPKPCSIDDLAAAVLELVDEACRDPASGG